MGCAIHSRPDNEFIWDCPHCAAEKHYKKMESIADNQRKAIEAAESNRQMEAIRRETKERERAWAIKWAGMSDLEKQTYLAMIEAKRKKDNKDLIYGILFSVTTLICIFLGLTISDDWIGALVGFIVGSVGGFGVIYVIEGIFVSSK